ncbi:hypothetical protein KCP69_22235 [Salmonella enterica subsp. enterica]|nr:hypothetical protein KCP69_22235 [Salmonella enterica subsp. enterica]
MGAPFYDYAWRGVRGTPLNYECLAPVGGRGIAISAMVTIFIGTSGLGHCLARLLCRRR